MIHDTCLVLGPELRVERGVQLGFSVFQAVGLVNNQQPPADVAEKVNVTDDKLVACGEHVKVLGLQRGLQRLALVPVARVDLHSEFGGKLILCVCVICCTLCCVCVCVCVCVWYVVCCVVCVCVRVVSVRAVSVSECKV